MSACLPLLQVAAEYSEVERGWRDMLRLWVSVRGSSLTDWLTLQRPTVLQRFTVVVDCGCCPRVSSPPAAAAAGKLAVASPAWDAQFHADNCSPQLTVPSLNSLCHHCAITVASLCRFEGHHPGS